MPDRTDRGGETPCFAHRLEAGQPADPETWRDVARFRKAERERLYALRRSMPSEERGRQTARVVEELGAALDDLSGARVAVYWPIRGELDLRGWMERIDGNGAAVALPVVTERDRPVDFHRWRPGCRMARGHWNIPVPAEPEPLTPDIVVIPLLGLDPGGYRLGNGGGYYDRTLAALSPAPRAVAVGQDFCRIPSIFPQPWDVPMDLAVLGDGTVFQRGPGGPQER